MDIVKLFSRKALVRIFFYFILLGTVSGLTFFSGIEVLLQNLKALGGLSDGPLQLMQVEELLIKMKHGMLCYLFPAIVAVFIVAATSLWMGLCRSLQALVAVSPVTGVRKEVAQYEEPVEDKVQKRQHDKQMFLYLMTLLQREGRLIDFLQEDLSAYEDEQIGAAVRGIHENCKKTIEKTLSPKPVLDSPEGETVTVAAGFDPGAIKLIGNVGGEPPFKGILRHRGWQTRKDELPTLSGTQDAGILSPAEVEILS